MARSVNAINASIISTLSANFSAVGITIDTVNWSRRNIIRLFCYSFAICIAYVEQLMDSLQSSLETTASKTPSASQLWVQAKMFLFQYSSTNPQVVHLIDMLPQYIIVDPTLRIITACAVSSDVSNEVVVKVAKTVTGSLAALASDELTAAQAYINTIGDAGVQYQVQSKDPDRIMINADIYYSGQYSSISANVITALVSFLQNLSLTNFDGAIKITDLESTIKSVSGVSDVVLKNVKVRGASTDFASGIYLVSNNTTIQRQWNTIAGYCDQENTSGYDFASTLNYISE